MVVARLTNSELLATSVAKSPKLMRVKEIARTGRKSAFDHLATRPSPAEYAAAGIGQVVAVMVGSEKRQELPND